MKACMKFTIDGGFKINSGIAEWHKEIIFKGSKANFKGNFFNATPGSNPSCEKYYF